MNEDIQGSDAWQETFSFYFHVHIADAKFYRNAVCLRLGGFRNKFSIKQMEEVCVEYGKVFEDISDTAPEYKDINSAKAYIKNTMGYTLGKFFSTVICAEREARVKMNFHSTSLRLCVACANLHHAHKAAQKRGTYVF